MTPKPPPREVTVERLAKAMWDTFGPPSAGALGESGFRDKYLEAAAVLIDIAPSFGLNLGAAESSARPAAEWVRCSERMPTDCEAVLVVDGEGAKPEPFVAYREEDGKWHVYSSAFAIVGVTHWMPLPPPPPGGT